jgi:hypothetical protein
MEKPVALSGGLFCCEFAVLTGRVVVVKVKKQFDAQTV